MKYKGKRSWDGWGMVILPNAVIPSPEEVGGDDPQPRDKKVTDRQWTSNGHTTDWGEMDYIKGVIQEEPSVIRNLWRSYQWY